MSTKNPAGWDQRRILLVAMVDSIHVARWIAQFEGTNTEFVIFPSTPNRRIHPMIQARLRDSSGPLRVTLASSMRWLSLPLGVLDLVLAHRLKGFFLRRFARGKHFDFVHVLELQHAGYIAAKAFKRASLPAPLITTCWGSDIFWFRQFPSHVERIREVLRLASFFSTDCERDQQSAVELGFDGSFLSGVAMAGGVDFTAFGDAVAKSPTSERRVIAVKGYDRFVGLAPVALRALELSAEFLGEYEVVIYSASRRIRKNAARIARDSGLRIRTLKPHTFSHGEMIQLLQRSRVHLGLSRSDGLPMTVVEAMATGCFPIQTSSSCVNEWLVHGNSGMLIDTPTVDSVAIALRVALADDALVDRAAAENIETIRTRLDPGIIQREAYHYYT